MRWQGQRRKQNSDLRGPVNQVTLGVLSGATNYWSAAVTVAAHGADDRPIAGATITVAWTGAVIKTSSCITAATGQCTLQSGTLSYLRSWVTLTVTNVSTPLSTYAITANHTLSRPGPRSR